MARFDWVSTVSTVSPCRAHRRSAERDFSALAIPGPFSDSSLFSPPARDLSELPPVHFLSTFPVTFAPPMGSNEVNGQIANLKLLAMKTRISNLFPLRGAASREAWILPALFAGLSLI